METIRTKVTVDAPVEVVWEQLTDFESYPAWNPLFRKLEGEPIEGTKGRIHVQRPQGSRKSKRIRFVRVKPTRRLTWTRGHFIPGLLERRHSIAVRSRGKGKTELTQVHLLSGVLARIAYWLNGSRLRRGLAKMNQRLKERIEEMEGCSYSLQGQASARGDTRQPPTKQPRERQIGI